MIDCSINHGSSKLIKEETATHFNINKNTTLLIDSIVDQDHFLWKFWLYYFLMKNKQLKKSQIGEIEDFLSHCEFIRDNLQSLDEDITTFILGYKILTSIGNNAQFKNKAEDVNKELEKHWNNKDKIYFKNDLYTLIILFCDVNNPHLDEVLKKYDIYRNYNRLPIIFLIMDQCNQKDEMKKICTELIERICREFYEIRESEKIFISWILWKYRRLLNSRIKDIRNVVSANLSTINDRFFVEAKEGTINFETVFCYDLLYDFYKESRIAFEEVPLIFRFFGIFNGILLIAFTLYVDYLFRGNGYLHHSEFISSDTFVNICIMLVSTLVVYLGVFLVYEIGLKGICANKEIKLKLNEWLIQKYFWGFVIGTMILGFATQMI